MKRILFAALLFAFCFPLFVMGQTSGLVEVKCTDYTCHLNKAQSALANKLYKEAIDYCRAAKAYPNANVSEADGVIYKILESIVAQKNIAENEKQAAIIAQKKAIEAGMRANDGIKKAITEVETASRQKDNEDVLLKRIDTEEKKALDAIKKADMDIEAAMREKEKAQTYIAQAAAIKQKSKSSSTLADSDEKKALDAKKRAEIDAENAKRDKQKADETIANTEKATLAATNLVKEVSNALTGEDRKEEKPQELVAPKPTAANPIAANPVAAKPVETPIKKEATAGVLLVTNKIEEPLPNKKNDINRLQRAIDAESDKLKAYKLQSKMIDSLEVWYQKDTIYRADLAESYANKAWSALFLKKYKDSEQCARMGLSIDERKVFINAIWGHALLFQGYYDQAMGIYNDFMQAPKQHRIKTNAESILEDLEVLKQEGITHKDVGRVKTALTAETKVR